MFKKIFNPIIFMIIGIFGLASCQLNSLDQYKMMGKNQIDAYVSSKSEEDYRTEKWTEILSIAKIGKQAVEDANDESRVDLEVEKTKILIDDVLTEFLSQFDLSDPKIAWNGSITDNFTDDMIIVTLRKTMTFPEIQTKHFALNNIEGLEYANGLYPPDYLFTVGNEEALEKYRQVVFIYITPHGKDAVVETIKKLEKLEFIKSVSPNNIESGD